MSEPASAPVPASGTVHWIGAGLSTGSGLRAVAELADRVVLRARVSTRAQERIDRLGLREQVQAGGFDLATFAGEVAPGDVVVSMVPADLHPQLLRICLERGAHFACSSYVSPAMEATAAAARAAGLVVLTEAGLDPGIDHLFAHLLVARGRAALAGTDDIGLPAAVIEAEFTSYCGGVPATPNAFRYRFSWAPRGVLGALRSPARYLEAGVQQTIERPWEAVRPLVLDGEAFEAYPNRDSLPFITQYGLPDAWRVRTFLRGTLRLDGWTQAWAPVFAELRAGDQQRINDLADQLAVRYPTTDTDRDRVVLAVHLDLRSADAEWSGRYLLDITGDEAESAMARCVSLPLAFGVGRILAGTMPPGLRRAAEDTDEAGQWMTYLDESEITSDFKEERRELRAEAVE